MCPKKENCRAHRKARHNKKYDHSQESNGVDLEMELDFLLLLERGGVCDVVMCSSCNCHCDSTGSLSW